MTRPRAYVSFAGGDWWYHGRAHADMQLMKELAAEHRVLIVNSIGMRFPTPGKTDAALSRILRKLRSTLRLVRRPMKQDRPNLWVMTPFSVPVFGWPRLRALNAWSVAAQVWLVKAALRIRDPWTIVVVPTAVDVADRLGARKRLYYRADNHAQGGDVDTELIRGFEDRLIASSAAVLYSSSTLLRDEQERHGGKGVLLDHGVDLDHFTPPDGHPIHPDVAFIPGPRIGFFGQIEDDFTDLRLLVRVADELPDAQLVLVGRATSELAELRARPNVHILGWREYDDVPDLGRCFDVGICPFPQSEWIRGSNPIKVKEYLALGLPVVSTYIPDMERYTDVVTLVHTPDEFIEALRDVLANPRPDLRVMRRERVRKDGWDRRAAFVDELCSNAERDQAPAERRPRRERAKVAISTMVHLVDCALAPVPRLRLRDRASGVVLLYHSVAPSHRETFTDQLGQLARIGRLVPVDDVLRPPDGTWRVGITFDDALDSYTRIAAPELAARSVPSTVFAPSGRLGQKPGWLGAESYSEAVATAVELAALPRDLVEIGSHSRSHVRLPTLGCEELSIELDGSRHELSELDRGPVRWIAFPYGDWDDTVVDACQAAGYERAFTVSPEPVRDHEAYLVPRVTIEPTDSAWVVRLKATGAYRWVGTWMRLKRRR